MKIVLAMGMTKREGGHEDGEEAITLDDFGEAIGDEGRGDCNQAVSRLGELGISGDPEGEPAEDAADQPAADDAGSNFPKNAVKDPLLQPGFTVGSVDTERDCKIHERKGQAVVQPRL